MKGEMKSKLMGNKLSRHQWIGFVAGRYISKDRRSSPAAIFSIVGICTGVLALMVIIAVMNGFQLGFIESILEISSGHLRIDNFPTGNTELETQIRSLPGIVSAVPFRETSVVMRGKLSSPRGAFIRGLPSDALHHDPGLASKLEMEEGLFDLDSQDSIILGAELARLLSVYTGDTVTVLSLSGGGLLAEDENAYVYTVKGIFRCGFHEYDMGWAFVNIERAAQLAGETSPDISSNAVLGIKLVDRWQDRKIMNALNQLLENYYIGEDLPIVTTWRDYNRSFFSALRTEKLMMFVLVGLIFIVVGLNIYQAQRRTVLERREEIGMLRALGASDKAVRMIFVLDGFIIGLIGAVLGLALGFLLSFNISAFFTFLEGIMDIAIGLINAIAGFFGLGGQGSYGIFSPTIFYIKEIKARIIPYEVVIIFFFGLLSSLVAAFVASGKVSKTRPAEVLRYE
ncbi:MAG: ABC transporter permease [Treponema sp.]|jgi:lipoprotein-releasing system permease protein|nr:ABC transporter permease [Treponema sp.]